jgi:hypothetical protein
MGSWNLSPGLNHVGAFQSSGQPWCSGGNTSTNTAARIAFPKVTRWIVITNTSANAVKVGFSSAGTGGSNYFTVAGNTTSPRLEVKISAIWIKSAVDGNAATVDVVAGLTAISADKVSTDSGENWAGEPGV